MEDDKLSAPRFKLYMILLGSKAPGRHVEQHDVFFGIARALSELVPAIEQFWPEAQKTIHIDGWREVNEVDGYRVEVLRRKDNSNSGIERLFFVNLGGYRPGHFEEQHFMFLTVGPDKAGAVAYAKKTSFFKISGFKGAPAHIDDKYGFDVDEFYAIEEMLSPDEKKAFEILLTRGSGLLPDPLHLGYIKLSAL